MSNNNKKIEAIKNEIKVYSEFLIREAIGEEAYYLKKKIAKLNLHIRDLQTTQNVAL